MLSRKPNPFTVRPIKTSQVSNELLLNNGSMRNDARISVLDEGMVEMSKYISPMHLPLGWKWK